MIQNLATLDAFIDEFVLAENVVEETWMPAQVAHQVAYFGSDAGVGAVDLPTEFLVDVDLVDGVIIFLRDPSQLTQDVECIEDDI